MRNFKFIVSVYTKIHHFEVKKLTIFREGSPDSSPSPVGRGCWGRDIPSPQPTPSAPLASQFDPGKTLANPALCPQNTFLATPICTSIALVAVSYFATFAEGRRLCFTCVCLSVSLFVPLTIH